MSYLVLARKWRPRSFDTLVGQEHVVRALTHALEGGRLHHAYLFTGTRGIGKTTVARILAKSLNCETGVSASPCGHCSACVEIDSGRFIDLLEVDAATNTRVDEMRQLLENAVYAPTRGRYKVYVIDEVHMLSNAAFNAMLKTLEEPPEHVKFILATTDPQKIPVTVLSRCLQFNLKLMTQQAISKHLAMVLESEQVSAESPALHLIAKAAGGSMRDALSLLDQAIAHGAGQVRESEVRLMLGTVGDDFVFEIVDALLDKDAARLIDIAGKISVRSLSFESALSAFSELMVRIQVFQLAPSDQFADDSERQRLDRYASQISPEYVQLAYGIALQGREQLQYAPDHFAGFVMTLLRLHAFAPSDTTSRLAEKKSSLIPDGAVVLAQGSVTPVTLESTNIAPANVFEDDVATGGRIAAGVGRVPTGNNNKTGDWRQLLADMQLSGMVRELAQNCELVESVGDRFELCLSPIHRHLQTRQAQDRLQQAIERVTGNPCRLIVTLADPGAETPAAQSARVRREGHDAAVEAIESDSNVRELIELFDATVIEPSVGYI